jgi:demethylmenaquinone methyltransferase/2-methoxy-6-polyprenyl-1,4-benzoquinol methylase
MGPMQDRDPRQIRQMFGRVARRYDLLNRLLSANLDRGWRRAAAGSLAGRAGARVLDVCCGTGDLTLAVARAEESALVVGCDFSHAMLALARAKLARAGLATRCLPVEADGLRLPFSSGAFDAVTVGFGVRNLADLDAGLREMHRVLRADGRLIVLEFSRPPGRLIGPLYRCYLTRILPAVGDGLSRSDGAYGYLARTIGEFPDPAGLAQRIREAGFTACAWRRLTAGIAAVHTGVKGVDAAGATSFTAQQQH